VQEVKNRRKRRDKRKREKKDKNADNNITKCHIYPNIRVISEFTI